MKNIISIILLLAVHLGCSSEERLENIGGRTSLDYSLDTVLIDPGEELLFVSGRLYQSDLSPDHRFLYNFNHHDHALEKIDLDEMRLVQKYPFEKEGPNGTGDFFRSFFLLDNDQLMIISFPSPAIFDLNGQKLQELKFQGVGTGADKIGEEQPFRVSMHLAEENDQYLGYVRNIEEKSTELMRVDLKEGWTKRISLPHYDRLKQFELQYTDGKSYMVSGPQTFMVWEGGKILLGSNLTNEIYEYLPEEDSLLVRSYQSQLTENAKTEVPATEFDSQQAFIEAIVQVREEISFSPPVWDENNRVYYRFSHKEVFEEQNTESFEWPTAANAEVFLTIFDENLDMLAESKIPDLSMPPQKHFVKDGKLWMFVNVEDEMGFARLSLDLGIEPLPADGIQPQ
ncbi:DUF4221 family protein [Cyclobacterium salsum]|uniref:DUF4221 family protein n=1 Tax=Cyclobacterium salsum TaxID=2666329 RepID=UPI0013911AC7|nr:DUF4221 family protein [Cyclobacterium salsum]